MSILNLYILCFICFIYQIYLLPGDNKKALTFKANAIYNHFFFYILFNIQTSYSLLPSLNGLSRSQRQHKLDPLFSLPQ